MIEPALRSFLEHNRRKQAVIILTILTALVVVWPAVDVYTAATQRTEAAQVQIEESRKQIARLNQYTKLHSAKQDELADLEKQLVSEQAAQALKSQLTNLGRETGCTVRNTKLMPPSRRAWRENDHPIRGAHPTTAGAETPFWLESRQLALTVTGPMPSLYKFLDRLHGIDKVVHSRSAKIQSGENGSTATLSMEILLFDLPRKPVNP